MRNMALKDFAFAALMAFFAMQGAIPLIAPNQALETTNAAASGLTYWGGIASQAAVYGAIVYFLCADLRHIVRWLGAMKWTAAIAILVVVSSAWSQFPFFTFRRSLPFAFAGLFGLCLALRLPVQRQLSILWMSMIGLAVGTIVLAVFLPQVGLDASAGHRSDWQGVFTQKNACGRIMVLATAVVLSQKNRSMLKILSLGFFLFVLVMSGSRGAWVIEAVVLTMYVVLRVVGRTDSRSRVLIVVFGLIVAAAIVGAVAANFAALATLLGRDATLTGRTEIWKNVWPFVMERPMLGWGYAGFWRGTQGESFRVVAAMRFIVFHAHNGFLEIWLELGAVGLFLFVCSYLRAWRKLWPQIRSGQMERVMWMLFVLMLIGLYDLDENTLMIYNGLFWVIYVATLVNIELLAVEDKLADDISQLLILAAADMDGEQQSASPPIGAVLS